MMKTWVVKMKKKFDKVYQFKITLRDTKPPVWRRILVPWTYTFWDLHVAIQDAMGWDDCHLHEFKVKDPSTRMEMEIGVPEKEYGECGATLPGWKKKLSDLITMENKQTDYIYDFGDNWEHRIELEKIIPRDKDIKYPICIKGKMACPPEDCGGTWGYHNLLEIMMDPEHDEHKEMRDWIGGEFDPEHFDPKDVRFDDPDRRLKMALE